MREGGGSGDGDRRLLPDAVERRELRDGELEGTLSRHPRLGTRAHRVPVPVPVPVLSLGQAPAELGGRAQRGQRAHGDRVAESEKLRARYPSPQSRAHAHPRPRLRRSLPGEDLAGGQVDDRERRAALARVDSHLPLPAEVHLSSAVPHRKRVVVDAPFGRPVVLRERAAVYGAEGDDGDARGRERERCDDGGVWPVARVREGDPPSLRPVLLHRCHRAAFQ
mmetsp:Transcript_3673/g.16121  ORF Transcript_3673/g.16121 Transcript_3673/m.16121 type:complete len:222 (-) Transcript_3673:1577-2242(-)